MISRISILFATATGFTACAVLPMHDGPVVYRSDVISSIQCQLYKALEYRENNVQPHRFLKGWTAAVSLTLDETNKAVQNAGFGDAIPLMPGILTFTAKGKAIGKAVRTAGTEFGVSLKSLHSGVCRSPHIRVGENGRPLLLGDLKITEEFKRFKISKDLVNSNGKLTSHSYTTDFTVEVEGEANATLTMIPIGTTTFGANFGVMGTKTKGHKMALTLKPPVPEPAPVEIKPVRVIIVGDTTGDEKGFAEKVKTLESATSSTIVRPALDPNSTEAIERALDAQARDSFRQIQRELGRERLLE